MPMMSTLNGCSRSVPRRSVRLIRSDITTGPAVNTTNSRANGSAKLHPVSVRASRVDPTRRAGPAAGPGAGTVVVPCAVSGGADNSATRADRGRLRLDRLRRVGAGLGALRDLLQLGVDARRDLLPGRDRRRRLGLAQLVAEHLQ